MDGETFVRLCRSRDFLAAALDQPLRLADAAKEACLSPFHYHRTFSRVFGETPHDFLRRLRIERAKQLLASTDDPVTEVCLAVGYESLGSFSAMFHSAAGFSPSAYRRSVRSVLGVPVVVPHRFIPNCFLDFYGAPTF